MRAVIVARGLSVARGSRVVVQAEKLEIGPGVTALVGPNGSGKSTLLHAIAGLLPTAGGTLRVLDAEPAEVRTSVAYVIQSQHAPAHLPVTVREIVTLGRAAARGPFRRWRPEDRRLVDDALERLELGALADSHFGDLSGGQRQRTFVAQGLAQAAEVLLLDEPTAGLDLASNQRIRHVLHEERAAGRTIVIATHDLAEAASTDHVVLLAGSIVAAGRPADVLVRRNLDVAYHGRLLDLDGELVLVDDGAHHHARGES